MILPEKKEENSDTASVQPDENTDSTQNTDVQTENTSNDEKKETETAEGQENTTDTEISESAEKKTDKKDNDSVTYEKDLSGEKIVLRGFVKNTQDISAYIYKLSGMPEITNVTLSGIEEQVFNNTEKITIFEAVLEVQ